MSDKKIELKQCSIEHDGTINCSIEKNQFNEIQKQNIKPQKIIFEVD